MVLPHHFLLVNPLELGEYYERSTKEIAFFDAQQTFFLFMKKYPHRRIAYSIGDINNFSAFIYATARVIRFDYSWRQNVGKNGAELYPEGFSC